MDVVSDRRFLFDAPRRVVWEAMSSTGRYRHWWPWLRGFEGDTFDEGAHWSCVVSPPLPYRLHFGVTLTEVADLRFVRARIDGDISGWAELDVDGGRTGCEVRLVSALSAASGPLRLVSRLAHPVAARGHDWVIDSGVRQFRRALDDAGAPDVNRCTDS